MFLQLEGNQRKTSSCWGQKAQSINDGYLFSSNEVLLQTRVPSLTLSFLWYNVVKPTIRSRGLCAVVHSPRWNLIYCSLPRLSFSLNSNSMLSLSTGSQTISYTSSMHGNCFTLYTLTSSVCCWDFREIRISLIECTFTVTHGLRLVKRASHFPT